MVTRVASTKLTRAVIEIERTWLGFTSPPLRVRLEEADWCPEGPEAACPRCGATAGPGATDETGCRECRDRKLPWEHFVRLGTYRGVLGEIVRDVKFGRFRTLGYQAGRLLGAQLGSAIAAAKIDPARVWVVPIPMSRRRYVERGIDHTLWLSRGVAKASGTCFVRYLRRRHGPTQLAVVPSARHGNVTKMFRTKSDLLKKERPDLIVVVDDVRTTGSTLGSACRTVRKSLPKAGVASDDRTRIWAAAVAVADGPQG